MAGPWDAPLALRQQFADEDDPEPPEFVEPPDRVLPDDFDPDELLGITHAYAGQVALVDLCLGMLLDAIDESPAVARCTARRDLAARLSAGRASATSVVMTCTANCSTCRSCCECQAPAGPFASSNLFSRAISMRR